MKKSGFGIAETLIASVILALLAVSFYSLNSVIQRNIALSADRAAAAAIAQQELEKLQFDAEWAWKDSRQSSAKDPNTWDSHLNADAISTEVPITEKFNRKYDLLSYDGLPTLYQGTTAVPTAQLSKLMRRVRVTISWTDGSTLRQYVLDGLITNWQPGLL